MMLIMFQYCPSCGKKNIRFEVNKLHCPDCGFVYFQNTAAATGCVIETDGKVLFLVRGREPSIGKLDLPGGFVDPGEGVLDGLLRELREELGWQPHIPPGIQLAEVLKLFASFPNVYPYKNIVYNTCDLFFTLSAPGLTEKDLHIEAEEIAGIRFLRPSEVNPDDLAFDSTRRVIAAYLADLNLAAR